MLLSAASGLQALSTSASNTSGTKELVIVSETAGNRSTQDLKIDEIRLVGDEVQVYSTVYSRRDWPGEPITAVYVFPFIEKSDPVTVTVPDRELRVVYFLATTDQARSELYNLRTFGDSTLLYRRADADSDSGWLTTDADSGAGSTVGLDFTAAPAAPTGLISTSASAASNQVTFWFDEAPTSTFTGQRFLRQYNVTIRNIESATVISSFANLTSFDNQRYFMTDAGGVARSFGGSKTLSLPVGVYTWRVQVRDLPVFLDGTTGTNALATPWSEFSEPARFAVLAPGEQIAVGTPVADKSTGIATVEWGSVANAVSYELWMNRVSNGVKVLHKTGLSRSSYQTHALDPDGYRVWVRATRADGTKTSWSKSRDFAVSADVDIVRIGGNTRGPELLSGGFGVTSDTTPTIEWTPVPQSTQYRISVINADRGKAVVYTRTVAGSLSSHTLETRLEQGIYRVEVTVLFSNGMSIAGGGAFIVRPAGLPMPLSETDGSFRWTAEEKAVSYDVWVAYLGQTSVTNPAWLPKWRFNTLNAVTSSSYQLPTDAPAGNYRIWIRPNIGSAGQTTKGSWSLPTDFASNGPLFRPMKINVLGKKLNWAQLPGASGYRVTIDHVNGIAGNGSTRVFNISATEFQIPDEFVDGTYSVNVQSLDAGGQPNQYTSSGAISIQHGKSPWTWNIVKAADSIKWNAVPDAVRYEIEISKFYNTIVTSATNITEPHFSLTSLEPGHYEFRVRALRSVDGREFLTQWTKNHKFNHGVRVPANVRLNGTTLTWDAQENVTYKVEVSIENGVYGRDSRLDSGSRFAIYPSPQFFSQGWIHTSARSVDVSEYIGQVYSYDRAAIVKVSVQAITTYGLPYTSFGFDAPLESDWSEPVLLPMSRSARTEPVIKTESHPKPAPPNLRQRSFPIQPNGNNLSTPADIDLESQPNDVALMHIYRTENGAVIDLEYVRRYQLRVTDLLTGVVRTFDDSQISELLKLQDDYERPVLRNDSLNLTVQINSSDSIITQLRLSSSVYKIEARVQYLPVIQSTSTSDPYRFSLTDTLPTHINVAATPWSDWSTPLEYTVLQDGQNILPIANPKGTIDPRPIFAWGTNTSDAQFQLWVENRATKQRVIHETLTNVRQFRSTTDMPPGQYDWWVRIVEANGVRRGWSPKQSLEVFAPATSANVVTETVDATPVVSWTPMSNAQSYFIRITSTSTGRVVYQATEPGNQSSHRVAEALLNDTYAVSIQATLSNGGLTAPGPANAAGGFIVPTMIVGAPPKNVTLTSSKVSWEAVNGATRYQVWMTVTNSGGTTRIFNTDAYTTELAIAGNLDSHARPGNNEFRVWVRAIRNEAAHESTGRWSMVSGYSLSLNASSARQVAATDDSNVLSMVMSELATSSLLDAVA